MNSSAPTANTDALIAQRLAVELLELEGFCSLLAEEQAVLKAGNADRLPELAERKSELAASLAKLLNQREDALSAAGYPRGRQGMESWLAAADHGATVNADWQKLIDLAAKARAEHELNGKLIAIQLQHNQQALAAIMSASGRPLTYGPDGHQKLGGGGRTLGTA